MSGGSPRRRAAVVVIHGIGDQPPLRTLGAFVQGLVRAARERSITQVPAADAAAPADAQAIAAPVPGTLHVAGRPRPLVRLAGRDLGLDLDDVDVLEYHWAEHAVGRIGAFATFGWLLGTALAGLDFRRQVPFLLAREGARAWPSVLRQLLWVATLAASAAGLVVAALAVAARAGAALVAVRDAVVALPGLSSVTTAVGLVAFGCLGIATVALGRDVLAARLEAAAVRRRHRGGRAPAWDGMYGPAARRWAPAAMAALALAVTATAALGWAVRPALAQYGRSIGLLMSDGGVAVGLLALAAAWTARALLASHVGDIALYVTSDRASARARTRRAVLDEGQRILLDLLGAGEERSRGSDTKHDAHAERGAAARYDAVILAGHSLGSVIALDLLDRLAREQRHREVPLERLRGLVTFGSPLDKVAYFFRQRPAEGEAVRSQLLSYLHGVRRLRTARDYGPYVFAPYTLPFARLSWLHVHAPADPLSDLLVHYRVDRLVTLPLRDPFTAHGAYWRDDRFYGAVLGWLRGDPVGNVVREDPDAPMLG